MQLLSPLASGPVNHRVETFTITGFFTDYLGIDINKESIKFALRKHNNHNIEYIVGDATIYNFKESFDYIILSNVLEHIKNRKEFLKTRANYYKIRGLDHDGLPIKDKAKELGLEWKI